MQFSSFSSLIKTIAILLFIYYAIKFLGKLLAPYLVKRMLKKFQQRFEGQMHQYHGSREDVHDTIYRNSQTNLKKNDLKEKKKVGEYIDYEEIN